MQSRNPTPEEEAEVVRLYEASRQRLTAEALVAAAKSSGSPLHGYFYEHSDAYWGEIGRREAARSLLRIVVLKSGDRLVSPPLWRRQPYGGYTSKERIVSQEELRRSMIKAALQELRAWEERYSWVPLEGRKELSMALERFFRTNEPRTLPSGKRRILPGRRIRSNHASP